MAAVPPQGCVATLPRKDARPCPVTAATPWGEAIRKNIHLRNPIKTMESSAVRIHESVTVNRVAEAVERHLSSLDNPGFCIKCGEEAEDVEPDARKYPCASCNEDGVYGAEELLIQMT